AEVRRYLIATQGRKRVVLQRVAHPGMGEQLASQKRCPGGEQRPGQQSSENCVREHVSSQRIKVEHDWKRKKWNDRDQVPGPVNLAAVPPPVGTDGQNKNGGRADADK